MLPSQAKVVTVMLDAERTIRYDNRAEFRMGSLERPFSVLDLRNKRRSWAALVAWVWACLSERDAVDFASPEAMAAVMRDEKVVDAAFTGFIETYSAAVPSASKKAEG